jgi:hypothetical protein
MNRFRLALSVILGAGAAAGVVVGCGGDDTVVPVTNDASAPDGSGADHFVPDTGSSDAGADAADTSSPTDGGRDANFDGSPVSVTEFMTEVATKYCALVEGCCEAIDAGGTSPSKCIADNLSSGFSDSNYDLSIVVAANDGGQPANVTIDPLGAATCLATIAALPCSYAATQQHAALNSCFGAAKGTLTAGQTCTYTVECAQPGYCKYSGGATGVCAALEASGNNCSNVNGDVNTQPFNAQEACSQRTSGNPASYCNAFNPDFSLMDASAWTCTPSLASGATCPTDNYCQTGICPTGTCADTDTVTDINTCQALQ